MKLIDVINKIDRSEKNEAWVDIVQLGDDLGILGLNYQNQEFIKSYWITNWLCVDTIVGHKIYFYKDQPIAYSFQNATKSKETLQWFSNESLELVRYYLISLIEYSTHEVEYVDLDIDLGEGYKVKYNRELLNSNNIFYKNEKVDLVERLIHTKYGLDTDIIIKYKGDNIRVKVEDLLIKFNLN